MALEAPEATIVKPPQENLIKRESIRTMRKDLKHLRELDATEERQKITHIEQVHAPEGKKITLHDPTATPAAPPLPPRPPKAPAQPSKSKIADEMEQILN